MNACRGKDGWSPGPHQHSQAEESGRTKAHEQKGGGGRHPEAHGDPTHDLEERAAVLGPGEKLKAAVQLAL